MCSYLVSFLPNNYNNEASNARLEPLPPRVLLLVRVTCACAAGSENYTKLPNNLMYSHHTKDTAPTTQAQHGQKYLPVCLSICLSPPHLHFHKLSGCSPPLESWWLMRTWTRVFNQVVPQHDMARCSGHVPWPAPPPMQHPPTPSTFSIV